MTVLLGWVLVGGLLLTPALAPAQTTGVEASVEARAKATTALFQAIARNDLPAAQAAIAQGGDITARNSDGQMPVDVAVQKGYFDIAHMLLSVRNFMLTTGEISPEVAAATPQPEIPVTGWDAKVETTTQTAEAPPAEPIQNGPTPPQMVAVPDPLAPGATPAPLTRQVESPPPATPPTLPGFSRTPIIIGTVQDPTPPEPAAPEPAAQLAETPQPTPAPESASKPVPDPAPEPAPQMAEAPAPPTSPTAPPPPVIPPPIIPAVPDPLAGATPVQVPAPTPAPAPQVAEQVAEASKPKVNLFQNLLDRVLPRKPAPAVVSDTPQPLERPKVVAPEAASDNGEAQDWPEPPPLPEGTDPNRLPVAPDQPQITELASAPESESESESAPVTPEAATPEPTPTPATPSTPADGSLADAGTAEALADITDALDLLVEPEETESVPLKEMKIQAQTLPEPAPQLATVPDPIMPEPVGAPEPEPVIPTEPVAAPEPVATPEPSLPVAETPAPAPGEPAPLDLLAEAEPTPEAAPETPVPPAEVSGESPLDTPPAAPTDSPVLSTDLPWWQQPLKGQSIPLTEFDQRGTDAPAPETPAILEPVAPEPTAPAETAVAKAPVAQPPKAPEKAPAINDLGDGLNSALGDGLNAALGDGLNGALGDGLGGDLALPQPEPQQKKGPKTRTPAKTAQQPPETAEPPAKTALLNADDWQVKSVETNAKALVKPVPPTPRVMVGQYMDNAPLALGQDHKLGQNLAESTPLCVKKQGGRVVFCVEEVNWSARATDLFNVSSIMYQGTKTIVRYDDGRASRYHSLFESAKFEDIVEHFTGILGDPTDRLVRGIAPLAKARQDNPVVMWQSLARGTNLVTTLELRQFDDSRGGFPDMKRGVLMLYHAWAEPIFPLLSTLELMALKSERPKYSELGPAEGDEIQAGPEDNPFISN